MVDMQAMIDAMGDANRDTRGQYHLTLEQAIRVLETLPDCTVRFDWNGLFPGRALSYRGYYSDLALDVTYPRCTVEDLLKSCRGALNQTFHGYKGGEYLMDPRTPLWAAKYGEEGRAIMAIDADSRDEEIILVTKEIKW